MKLVWQEMKNFYFCRRVSPVRPAPTESPQGRKAARVGGCSGATQVAYPLFSKKKKRSLGAEIKNQKKSLAMSKEIISFAAAVEKQRRSEKKLTL